jgi:hypothetical protein
MGMKLGILPYEKHREYCRSMLQNRKFWKIFVPEREEVTRGWIKLHNGGASKLVGLLFFFFL